jgi:exosome complex RNA-binding protein Rrp4
MAAAARKDGSAAGTISVSRRARRIGSERKAECCQLRSRAYDGFGSGLVVSVLFASVMRWSGSRTRLLKVLSNEHE